MHVVGITVSLPSTRASVRKPSPVFSTSNLTSWISSFFLRNGRTTRGRRPRMKHRFQGHGRERHLSGYSCLRICAASLIAARRPGSSVVLTAMVPDSTARILFAKRRRCKRVAGPGNPAPALFCSATNAIASALQDSRVLPGQAARIRAQETIY